NGLSMNDLFQCPRDDRGEKVTLALIRNWEAEKRKKAPSYGWVMFRTFAVMFVVPLAIYLFEECFLRIVQPLALGMVIRYFNGDKSISYLWACIYAGVVCLCTLLFVSMHHPTMQQVMRVGM